MRYLKRYAEGGGIPDNPLANPKTNEMLRHISKFGEDDEVKYDASDLLKILSFSKAAKPKKEGLLGGVDFNTSLSPADFVSYKTKKKGDTRIAEYDEEKEGYNPSVGAMSLKKSSLEKLADRPLKESESRNFRKLLSDPTLLRYFMDMVGEKDISFRDAKLGKVTASRGGGGDKATRNRCPGGICPSSAYD